MEELNRMAAAVKIGDLTVKKPVIQGGMGIGISLSSLAGAVAKEGGIGIISAAQIGFRDPDFYKDPAAANKKAIQEELKKAREIAPDGVIGFNIMVATNGYEDYVKEAARAGADVIISGAGLPTDLPKYIMEVQEETGSGKRTMIAPIVSTEKSARVLLKLWDRKYHFAPDFVVAEGPLAGGHLGFHRDQLAFYGGDPEVPAGPVEKQNYENEILKIVEVIKEYSGKYEKKIPLFLAGGIFDHEDVKRAFRLGADGVQVGTRFVATEECDAPDAYKEAYVNASEKDVILVKSPVGMPGRAIRNPFLDRVIENPIPVKHCFRCLSHCNPATVPYCITEALIRAAKGDVDNGLIFCGSNAGRIKKIETVRDVMEDLISKK